MNIDDIHAYKEAVAELYSARSTTYDASAWHGRIARNLVDYAHLKPDAQVLDIGTGTGMVALYAASILGPRGSVIGIDLAQGMIDVARAKLRTAESPNVTFELGDGESLDYAPGSFDVILCGSAFIWMTDLLASLVHWRSLLKSNGKVGLHAFSEDAFVTGRIAQSVLRKYGVEYAMSAPTGSVEKCKILFEQAGYSHIEIRVDTDGMFIEFEQARKSWVSLSHPAPGQYPHPLSTLSPEQLARARADYEHEIDKLNTNEGIWNDMTTFYVYGEK